MCYFDCKIHKKTPSQTMYICEFLLHIRCEGLCTFLSVFKILLYFFFYYANCRVLLLLFLCYFCILVICKLKELLPFYKLRFVIDSVREN